MTAVNQNTNGGAQSGFVLPYVLVVIAILAIAGTIAAQRLQKASQIVGDMQDRARAERILISAEAAATYSLLTGNPVEGGYDISPNSPIIWEFGLLAPDGRTQLRADAAASIPADIWRGTGQLRRYVLGAQSSEAQGNGAQAVIAYRDATGLVSLNENNPTLLLPLLMAAGASQSDARKALATLADYIDSDENRRPDGAESFNYRSQNLAPPANAPLRSYSELNNIIGWPDMLRTIDTQALKDMTTLKMGSGYRQSFSSAALTQAIGLKPENEAPNQEFDIMTQLELKNKQPSQLARLTIWAPRNDGRYQKRVVDIERFLGGIGEPYRRHWVYDSTVLESDLRPYAGTLITAQNGPLQLNELDNVVHASSLRP